MLRLEILHSCSGIDPEKQIQGEKRTVIPQGERGRATASWNALVSSLHVWAWGSVCSRHRGLKITVPPQCAYTLLTGPKE